MELVNIFKRIKNVKNTRHHVMPLSLRIIKELSSHNIDYKELNLIDVLSLVYSIRIDNAKQYLEAKRKQKLNERGIKDIVPASNDDIKNL